MFRFTMDNTVDVDITDGQLVSNAIGRDDDFAEGLRETGEYNDNETVFRAENENPASLEDAVEWVQGIFFHPPTRVWLGGDIHEVTDDVVARVRKPGA